MEGKCEECMSWAKDIYWTHFESMHFIQVLEAGFRTQLMIPRKFSENARGKLQENVTLKGPSGTATWQVRLMACGDDLFLKGGWQEFANAFSLEENDILIFKYKSGSCFDILIFDRETLCEKETSYFIRRCGHLKRETASHDPRCLQHSPEDVVEECSSEDVETSPPKKLKQDIDNDLKEVSPEKKAPTVDVDTVKVTPKLKESHFSWVPVKLPSVEPDQRGKLRKKAPDTDTVRYVFGSSSVTEERMKQVLQNARKELTEGSFLVVMRPTHVSRKFYLSIPAEWIAKYLNYRKQDIRLRINDKRWLTRIIFSSKGRGGLGLGWKQFALDNCLEELDVLVFKPAKQKDEPVLLDVNIFRITPK